MLSNRPVLDGGGLQLAVLLSEPVRGVRHPRPRLRQLHQHAVTLLARGVRVLPLGRHYRYSLSSQFTLHSLLS